MKKKLIRGYVIINACDDRKETQFLCSNQSNINPNLKEVIEDLKSAVMENFPDYQYTKPQIYYAEFTLVDVELNLQELKKEAREYGILDDDLEMTNEG